MVDLSVNMFGIDFKNPVFAASGTAGYGIELVHYIDLEKIGALITKGVSPKPKSGNPQPRIIETPSGILNSIGLQNIGVKRLIDEVLPELEKYDTSVIVNIFGDDIDGYINVAGAFLNEDRVDALEVNLSCPNVKEGGIAFGRDPKISAEITSAVVEASQKPVIAKLTPNVTDIAPIAKAVEEAGAAAVSVVNTLLGMAVDVETRRPYFKNVTAGLSGPAIRPVALRFVWETARAVKIPVIGIGGITSGKDALEFIMAGAAAVQVGSANLVDPGVISNVIDEIEDYCTKNGISDLKEIRGIIKEEI
ncbi:MAG: dihydroorotate dehydrogenase [Deltaproteobacteria bacterium]|uniref:Dihydroorotate dehydrogenase n=1 Tax=Candidatus Zymogenus saltonus TaxID=2844893 RepID=A0A9D8KG19_9DELT|nr:dihydroorotate dehydrogenase [Candidatus Zymogenus saltonus]